jgi:hypothetical protein
LSVLLLFDERILITPLVSFGHCVVCSSFRWTDSDYPFGIVWPLRCLFFFSSIYGFWLPLSYLLAIALSVLLLFDIRIIITPLLSVGHCVVKDTKGVIRIRISKRRRTDNAMAKRFQRGNRSSSLLFTDSDYPFGIFWPLCCLFFFSMNGFWLPLWNRLAIVRTDKAMAKRKCTKRQTRKIRCTEGVLGVYTTCTNNIKWHVDLNVYVTWQ